MKLVLTESQKAVLLKHAEEKNPNESCALLFGNSSSNEFVVRELFLAENSDESPIEFTISNKQLLEGYEQAERKNLEVVGIFHSHPHSDSFPSNTDKKFMEINPVLWVIFSGITKKFKAFVLDKEIIEIPIVS